MRASWGPTLRNSLASIVSRKTIVSSNISAITIDGLSIDITPHSVLPLRLHGVFPRAHGRNSFLVAGDHDFQPFGDGDAILATGAGDAARAGLRIDQLPGAAGADPDAQLAEDT